ncbi:cellulase family glycosylhydrolase [Pelagicoccus sp. SDUM812005]|uniref:cellulase family glycosylhydrolase n=1 Tax=Pelagicoccus sp. SDUM812005 TaxID=3041257 RepID=UPI00280F632B|nr:cellulase family glycosylhydrolase [Pelagicoccus sp. SDUM812005]MDQ8183167.1 cellulase family glycosylhydrolase [Pelagicoccus sp. SDUM812005]
MKKITVYSLVLATLLAMAPAAFAQIKHGLRDEQGRHVVPRGFVVNTNDAMGQIEFFEDDYARMVRMGANFQVIRLELGRVSEFPGCQVEEAYLQKLDRLVRRGREAGIQTVFKMTVYGAKGFGWESFWANENNAQGTYLDAWKVIWERYQDNVFVVGYDLVNEPRKLTMDITYDELTENYLVPYYERLIDAASEYSDSKLYLCQTIFMNKGEAIEFNQYAEIKKPIDRPNVVFAPHIYQEKLPYIEPTMQRFDKESDMLNAPILIGEWGFPTYRSADGSVSEQLEYISHYTRTAEIFDQMGVGSIKAWFLGTRKYNNFLPGGESTWAIFVDEQAAGTVERKYITDIICRPYPQSIAGDLMSFMYHHATRTLEVAVKADNSKGASRIFVAADRHYPDGFTVSCGDDLVLTMSPLDNGRLRVVKSPQDSSPSDFVWNVATQQLVVLQWPLDGEEIALTISPGIAVSE